MLQTNRIPAIFQNRDENPPTYRHTPTFVKHSKRFYPSHPPPPHTSTSSTPTHHHHNTPSPQHTITPTRLTALRSLHGGKPPPARLLPAGQYTAPPSAGDLSLVWFTVQTQENRSDYQRTKGKNTGNLPSMDLWLQEDCSRTWTYERPSSAGSRYNS